MVNQRNFHNTDRIRRNIFIMGEGLKRTKMSIRKTKSNVSKRNT